MGNIAYPRKSEGRRSQLIAATVVIAVVAVTVPILRFPNLPLCLSSLEALVIGAMHGLLSNCPETKLIGARVYYPENK